MSHRRSTGSALLWVFTTCTSRTFVRFICIYGKEPRKGLMSKPKEWQRRRSSEGRSCKKWWLGIIISISMRRLRNLRCWMCREGKMKTMMIGIRNMRKSTSLSPNRIEGPAKLAIMMKLWQWEDTNALRLQAGPINHNTCAKSSNSITQLVPIDWQGRDNSASTSDNVRRSEQNGTCILTRNSLKSTRRRRMCLLSWRRRIASRRDMASSCGREHPIASKKTQRGAIKPC